MPLTQQSADLVGYDSQGRVCLLAEVKGRKETTAAWASEFRRNLLDGDHTGAPLFVIAARDNIYVWLRRAAGASAPQYVLDAQQVLDVYLSKVSLAPEEIRGETFKFVVLSWLRDLAGIGAAGKSAGEKRLADALKNTHIES